MTTDEFLDTEWLHLRVRSWLLMLIGLAAGGLIIGIFFVRRQLIEFRPEHTFNVHAPEFFGSAHALGDPLPVEGNRITILQNGAQIFPAMLDAIRHARKSINFEAFIFESDEVGHQFRDAFCERAKAGVKVRVLLDGIGSSTKLKNADVEMLKQAGCEFAYYHPTISLRVDKMNRRSHRRIMVVDGRLGFTGGVGFAKEWQGNADSKDHWRDLHLKVEGPLVAELQSAFQQHWLKETKAMLTGGDEFPELPKAGPHKAQAISSYSYSTASIPLTQAVAIAAAEKDICITNAYCTPTKDQTHLLAEAAKRGVNVRLLVPGKHNDQPATKAVGRGAYGKLLEAGVRIFEYEPTMIHQKTMVVDSLFSLIGTSNLDARSAQINEEVDLSVYDAGFGKQMMEIFEADVRNSRPYTLEEFKKRGLWERFSEWVARPFRSQL